MHRELRVHRSDSAIATACGGFSGDLKKERYLPSFVVLAGQIESELKLL